MSRQKIIISLFVSCLAVTLACGAPTLTNNSRAASLTELRNSVESKTDPSAQFKNATEGDKIIAEGKVKTGTDSRVRINITDGTIIRLGDNTDFTLKELSSNANDPVTNLTLVSGKLWVAVTSALGNGSFDVQTPVGVATVRGSFMSVEVFPNTGQMIVSCLEGLCRLTSTVSKKFVDLKTAEQAEISGTGQDPTPPQKIDAKQVNDWRTIFPEAATHVVAVGTPGPQPTATVARGGSGAPVGGNTSLTACDHPYLPLRAGATWTYSGDNNVALTWTVMSVQGDKTNATAEIKSTTAQVQMTQTIQCTPAGIAANLFGALNIPNQFSGSVATTKSSGVFLPPADQLRAGFAWTFSTDQVWQFTPQAGNMSINISNTNKYTVANLNPLTLNGKTYAGLQVTNASSTNTQVTIPNAPVAPAPKALDGTATLSFAKGVGLTQISSQSEGRTFTLNLTNFNVP